MATTAAYLSSHTHTDRYIENTPLGERAKRERRGRVGVLPGSREGTVKDFELGAQVVSQGNRTLA